MTLTDVEQKIRAAIDAAGPAGMCLRGADFDAEINSRLDVLAVELMGTRPDLTPMSLDEWLVENFDALSEDELAACVSLSGAYFEGE